MLFNRYFSNYKFIFYIKLFLKFVFAIFLVSWLVVSVLRITRDYYELINNYNDIFISNNQKQIKYLKSYLQFKKNIDYLYPEGSTFILVTDNAYDYFYLRNLMYPKRVYWIEEKYRAPSDAIQIRF